MQQDLTLEQIELNGSTFFNQYNIGHLNERK